MFSWQLVRVQSSFLSRSYKDVISCHSSPHTLYPSNSKLLLVPRKIMVFISSVFLHMQLSLWLCEHPFPAQLWNNYSFKTQHNEAFPDSLGTTDHPLLLLPQYFFIFLYTLLQYFLYFSDLLGGDYVLLNLSLQYLA